MRTNISVTESEKTPASVLTPQRLLDIYHILDPEDLAVADLSSYEFASCDGDFTPFRNLTVLNVSENGLQLHDLACFSSLQELSLCFSGIVNLSDKCKGFQKLKMLDLSFNRLHYQEIANLGGLQSLEVLRLSENGLKRIPAEMAAPGLFQKLKTLELDRNLLSSPELFLVLSRLPRLKSLNLNDNKVSAVPCLIRREFPGAPDCTTDAMASAKSLCESLCEQGEAARSAKTRSVFSASGTKRLMTFHKEEPETTEARSSKIQDLKSRKSNDAKLILLQGIQTYLIDHVPFSELENIHMCRNRIKEERHLWSLMSWPGLKNVHVSGNRMTMPSKRDQSTLLKYFDLHHVTVKYREEGSSSSEKIAHGVIRIPRKYLNDRPWLEDESYIKAVALIKDPEKQKEKDGSREVTMQGTAVVKVEERMEEGHPSERTVKKDESEQERGDKIYLTEVREDVYHKVEDPYEALRNLLQQEPDVEEEVEAAVETSYLGKLRALRYALDHEVTFRWERYTMEQLKKRYKLPTPKPPEKPKKKKTKTISVKQFFMAELERATAEPSVEEKQLEEILADPKSKDYYAALKLFGELSEKLQIEGEKRRLADKGRFS